MSERTDRQRETAARARHAWAIMTDSEKSSIRIGVIPHWATLEDFGGRAGRLKACWLELATAEEHRSFAVALFQCATSEERF